MVLPTHYHRSCVPGRVVTCCCLSQTPEQQQHLKALQYLVQRPLEAARNAALLTALTADYRDLYVVMDQLHKKDILGVPRPLVDDPPAAASSSSSEQQQPVINHTQMFYPVRDFTKLPDQPPPVGGWLRNHLEERYMTRWVGRQNSNVCSSDGVIIGCRRTVVPHLHTAKAVAAKAADCSWLVAAASCTGHHDKPCHDLRCMLLVAGSNISACFATVRVAAPCTSSSICAGAASTNIDTHTSTSSRTPMRVHTGLCCADVC